MGSKWHGGGYGGNAPQLPFELFPEMKELGTASIPSSDSEEAKTFAIWFSKFERYYKNSPYYVEDGDGSSKKLRTELETFSNRGSVKNVQKGRLSDFIYMDPIYVPAELAKGDKGRHGVKRVRWNPDSVLDDLFTKSLQREQAADEKKDVDDKKEEEEEEDHVDEEEEEDDENDIEPPVFSDDEDDLNDPVEGGDDEDAY